MTKFGDAERRIKRLLSVGERFQLDGEQYTIKLSEKPTCSRGEPKTDIFVRAVSLSGKERTLKISFKKENAEFLENKITADRAERLFGKRWQRIIMEYTQAIEDAFRQRPLIYKDSFGRTRKGSITLGWKFEILNRPSGYLSAPLFLAKEQLIDIYAGTSLPKNKRHPLVAGEIVENAGVANYILISGEYHSVQDIIDNLVSIEDYVDQHPEAYFACKALNYRTYERKYDGNRPLAVYVDWGVRKGRLTASLVFDNPLLVGGTEVHDKLVNCLEKLGIDNTRQITESNVWDPGIVHGL